MSLDSATEYALSFSGDAVHLQHRERMPAVAGHRRPWRHLGSVEFDDPQFRDSLTQLRRMASGQDGDAALPVTLVIPDDQILYTGLTVGPAADRESAVGRALDGLTPYPIADLAFDWDGDGEAVQVAAVARQTLREARDFAAQYGFEGTAYCADPQDGGFPGEPVFVLDPPEARRPAFAAPRTGDEPPETPAAETSDAETLAAETREDETPKDETPDTDALDDETPTIAASGRGLSAAQLELPAEMPAEEPEPEPTSEPEPQPEDVPEPKPEPEDAPRPEPQPVEAPATDTPGNPAEPAEAPAESDPVPVADPPAPEQAEAPASQSARVPPVVRHAPRSATAAAP
ncbi:hypothetical protein CDV54_20680, partial [Paracoccus yeei]